MHRPLAVEGAGSSHILSRLLIDLNAASVGQESDADELNQKCPDWID